MAFELSNRAGGGGGGIDKNCTASFDGFLHARDLELEPIARFLGARV